MKKLFIVWLLFGCVRLYAQPSGNKSVRVFCGYSTLKLSDTSRLMDIKVIIVNNDSVVYYYPKAYDQKIMGNTLTASYKRVPYQYARYDLSFDVVTNEVNNSYDSLITLKPLDTLVVQYNDVYISARNKNLVIDQYIAPDKRVETSEGGARRFNWHLKNVQVIEYRMEYVKGKLEDGIRMRKLH